jgi:hypothetical protein
MDRHPLTPGGNTLVILDTCVLLPSRLSDVLFDLMLEGLYFTYWTGDVEAEFLRNWPQVHPDASKSGAKRLKAFQRATNDRRSSLRGAKRRGNRNDGRCNGGAEGRNDGVGEAILAE